MLSLKYSWMITVKQKVLTPSSDYYARHGDSDTDEITVVTDFHGEYDTPEEALECFDDVGFDPDRCTLVQRIVESD